MIVKGHEIKQPVIRDSYDRRAVLFMNNIFESLRKIGIHEDDMDVKLQRVARLQGPASASWYFDGRNMYFSYKSLSKYIENLFVVSKVIEFEVKSLLEGRISSEEFVQHFAEDRDIEKQRKEARSLLEVPKDCNDLELINKHYKLLAKKHHPDAGGNMNLFKRINEAHKMLKRELS